MQTWFCEIFHSEMIHAYMLVTDNSYIKESSHVKLRYMQRSCFTCDWVMVHPHRADVWDVQLTATLCNTLKHTATHCNTLQRTASTQSWHMRCSIDCNHNKRVRTYTNIRTSTGAIQYTATHCNTLQHTATHCTTINVCAPIWAYVLPRKQSNTLPHTATHCNTLQHTATHCNTPQHTASHQT